MKSISNLEANDTLELDEEQLGSVQGGTLRLPIADWGPKVPFVAHLPLPRLPALIPLPRPHLPNPPDPPFLGPIVLL